MKTRIKKLLTTIVKIAASLFFLWLVYSKISFIKIWEQVQNLNISYFILAIVAYIMSQIISSERLLLFFHRQSFLLNSKSNLLLYLIGMFYNFFIPGGVGGDAYKVYLLNKKFGWKSKKLGAAILADRVSGLVAICCWLGALSLGFTYFKNIYGIIAVIIIECLGIWLSLILFKKIFPSFKKIFFKSLIYSIIIQGLQLITVLFILIALDKFENYIIYGFLFLLSSILSIFSFSGIGIREYVFYKCSLLFQFNSNIAVSVGFIFTMITLIVSLPGIFLVFLPKKLLKLSIKK